VVDYVIPTRSYTLAFDVLLSPPSLVVQTLICFPSLPPPYPATPYYVYSINPPTLIVCQLICSPTPTLIVCQLICPPTPTLTLIVCQLFAFNNLFVPSHISHLLRQPQSNMSFFPSLFGRFLSIPKPFYPTMHLCPTLGFCPMNH
jgi:hypothetical protein